MFICDTFQTKNPERPEGVPNVKVDTQGCGLREDVVNLLLEGVQLLSGGSRVLWVWCGTGV